MAEEKKMSVEVEVSLEARLAGSAPDVAPYPIGGFSIDVPLRLGWDDDGFGSRLNPKNSVNEIVIVPDQVCLLERFADALYEAASVTRKRAAELAILRARVEREGTDRG